MRFRFAGPGFAVAFLSCASRAAPVATSPAASCPYRVLVTMANPRQIAYDIYYNEQGKPATILGEIQPGSTVTFQIPGEGRGYARLQRPAGDTAPIPYTGRPLPETRVRMHCAGN
jgi:hypothetical protein